MSLRNVAIIAHVDHGKTTLVDQLFRQSGTFRDNQRVEERAMDSNDLEKERGITILAKCTSVDWENSAGVHTRINIVDTPGHADFGGEVERILSMVDGVILLVDAAEGAMPQTKFVTGKALALGLRPIVVVNKIDRADARAQEVLDEVFDLFVSLDANDEQLDFPVLFASGRNGYAGDNPDVREGTLAPLFDKIVEHVPAPAADPDGPFKFLVTLLDRDNFVGRILTGLIASGSLKLNMPIHALDNDGNVVETGRASKIMAFRGLERVPVEEAQAGDIVSIAGLTVATVANTIADPSVTEPLHAQPIDPPTLSMRFAVNDSPMAGREGTKVTSRMIRDRLFEKYGPHKGKIEGRKNGVLISNGSGEANNYALGPLEERGILFVGHQEALYEGMIVGENAKTDDLEVNPMKAKQLTNFRASGGKDDAIRLTPPKRMTLEQAIAYIDDDELVEVTPTSIRLRKRHLDPHERKRASRAKQAA
jgi:GTP-binding protein